VRERNQVEIDFTRLLDHILGQLAIGLLVGGLICLGFFGAFFGALYLLLKLFGRA
jgi:predicted lipid-binding transport protein (Tim44 family)